MTATKIRYLDLFAGIGGFALGIGDKGECIGFSEIDKYATKVYLNHFPNHEPIGDITKINADELPDFDFLVGGFPCQSFSIAGKRKGFDDTRGTLFFDIARILKAKTPKLLLLENVKGLLSHDNGNTFKTIISTLDELGYDLQWQVLNSKNHGVPQNRERIFIIGHLRGTSRPQVFPIGGADQEVDDSRGLHTGNKRRVSSSEDGREEIEHTGDTHNQSRGNDPLYERGTSAINQLNSPTHSNDRIYGEDGISPTLNTMQGGNWQPFVATGELEYVGSLNPVTRKGTEHQAHLSRAHKQPARVYDEKGINPALSAGENQGRYHTLINDMKIRRLTPTECERLQGFPDKHTYLGSTIVFDEKGNKKWKDEFISDSQRYKMCGNAVTVNVIRDIMEKLLV